MRHHQETLVMAVRGHLEALDPRTVTVSVDAGISTSGVTAWLILLYQWHASSLPVQCMKMLGTRGIGTCSPVAPWCRTNSSWQLTSMSWSAQYAKIDTNHGCKASARKPLIFHRIQGTRHLIWPDGMLIIATNIGRHTHSSTSATDGHAWIAFLIFKLDTNCTCAFEY